MLLETSAYVETFKEHCRCDKNFIPYIINTYPSKVLACGRHLFAKEVRWGFVLDPNRKKEGIEFLDFINGNGFKVVKTKTDGIFHIYPIYDNRSD